MKWNDVKDELPSIDGIPWNIEVLVAQWDSDHSCYDYFVAQFDFQEKEWVSTPICIQGDYPMCTITKPLLEGQKWQFIDRLENNS